MSIQDTEAIFLGENEISDIYYGNELIYSNVPPTVTISASTDSNYLFGMKATLTSNEKVDLTGKSKYKWTQSSTALGTDASAYTDGTITSTNQSLSKPGKSGSNYLHVLAVNTSGSKAIEYISSAVSVASSQSYSYSGNSRNTKLLPGKYKLQVWGAQGGSYSSYYGGKGGYSEGILTLSKDTPIYVYVGGQPSTSTDSSVTIAGGFNGGGRARYHSYSGTTTYCQAGGGASDIRIGQDSLYARVIVAGGGGGSASVDAATTKYGGGTNGGSPQSGYAGGTTSAGTNGSFGQGGDGYISGYNYKYASGGGGGGWYGGGGCSSHSDSTNYRGYNGGGSGYVYTSSTSSQYPSGCLLNSTYYLGSAKTVAGNTSFTSTSGGTETGHSGNGYAIITNMN